MVNPMLVEVLRGGLVESRHAGSLAVVDADGAIALALGDIERPVFPRSAVKALQAVPLVESGAADAFTQEELALACASHSGEPGHVATAQQMLTRADLDASALRCGAHAPLNREAAVALFRSGCSRRRSTTTARASMQDSCAWPAISRPRRVAIASQSIRCSAKSGLQSKVLAV